MADVESQFEAAVKVIRSMPKKGAYQPSYETMLKFYGYFKQAKEGPCTESKPGFWDVVKKAKWEAWSALGNISKEEAMECYINELKQVMETMPDTEEMADFSTVLKSFYEAVYEPSGQEPPHILRVFKKSVESPEKANYHNLSKEMPVTNSQSYDEKSKTFENDRIEISLENVLKSKEADSNDQINGDHIDADVLEHYSLNHDSNNTMNILSKSDENAKDAANSLEDVGDKFENVNGSHLNASLLDDAHITSLQPNSLYIVEVSNKKKGSPLNKEDSEDLLNDNDHGQNPQLRVVQSTMKDNGQTDQSSALPSSDESEDEEFCDSIDPEHLSVLQSGLVDTHKLNGSTESHNSSASTSSPDHIPASSLTESDMSDVENEELSTTNRHTSTPFEKKPVHVTFDDEEKSTTKTKHEHKDSNGRRRVNEPHIAPTNSNGLKASNHLNGGILKVKQAGSGCGGGDASKGLRQPPASLGFSQTSGQGGGLGSNAGNSLPDSRMLHGRSAGHSDSDSDDTNPNGESCDSCGEREEINERIMIALERLQQDMSRVLRRLGTMEDVMALRQERLQNISTLTSREDQGSWWRQFIPSKTVAFLILWPFIINLIFYSWRRRKAHNL
ncbi:acyl-CoA-binding domain-containing protein 5-like isoform X2 [Actinia tenebrosa]|uniref:Acyl-CoA-binding domain-containing protein 5-like isoform X2 n=1 Tax=Actinia tenebrosa TaxID=6105 RepID=A0A6P8IES3_ACTTE|nr:acyl-CoA-binding domain-containing protein 5-like isoform X2 [Actinia tenebrosa]